MTQRPPERDDLDALLDTLITFAQQTLEKRGGFLPFGAVMKTDGDVTMVTAYLGTEHPNATDLMAGLRAGMRKQAADREIRAAGICYEVTVRSEGGQPSDAIAAALEHEAGDAVEVMMPYTKPRFGSYAFGELAASRGERQVFS